jgi:5-methylcytosine-specific restriction endonuclease McrA
MCGERATDVDHVVNRARGGGDSQLQSLCGPHHREKSSREGNNAQRELRLKRLRPGDRHPGVL